jgi:hypothetical protein
VPTPTIERATVRARAVLTDGHSVVDAIAAMREDRTVRNIDCIAALREVVHIMLPVAMEILDDPPRYTHIGLRELRHLEQIVAHPLERWLRDAILADKPWLLVVPNGVGSIRYYRAETPDESGGTWTGDGVTVAREQERVQKALANPSWADEVRVMRNEPELLLLYFPFVAR